MEHKLTLLVGSPRSGTTWLGKIFDSHPATLYRHEPDNPTSLGDVPLFADAGAWAEHTAACYRFVADLPAMNSSRVAATLPIFPKNYLSSRRLWLQRIAIFANRAAEAIGREPNLPAVKSGTQLGQLHVVWKSIESTGRLGIIARAIPDCRVIMILRHPCAYVASLVRGETKGQFTQSDARCEDYEIFAGLLARQSA